MVVVALDFHLKICTRCSGKFYSKEGNQDLDDDHAIVPSASFDGHYYWVSCLLLVSAVQSIAIQEMDSFREGAGLETIG